MESLLANYASSDDEDENEQPEPQPPAAGSSLFSSLPKPNSSSASLFSSLPQTHPNPQRWLPKPFQAEEEEDVEEEDNNSKPTSKSSSLFSSIPRPRLQTQQQPLSNPLPPFNPNPPPPPNSISTSKRVVQFKPPVIVPSKPSADDDDDEDEEEERRRRRRDSESLSQSSSSSSSSVKSFLSSIPAPKNSSSSTLGVLPSAAGAGRRSILETEALTPSSGGGSGPENLSSRLQQDVVGNYDVDYASYGGAGSDQNGGEGVNYVNYGDYSGSEGAGIYQDVAAGDALSYGGYEGHTGYAADYGQYSYTWSGGDAASVPPALAPEPFNTAGQIESTVGLSGKRGRKDMPTEIVEVKQDELMKNRPREDQAKLTGIAFGPAYQPVSTKGKPSKLQKRKHQIGSLYFDMKQKEMELAERRAKGFLTKAQTQGKYGW